MLKSEPEKLITKTAKNTKKGEEFDCCVLGDVALNNSRYHSGPAPNT